MNQQRQVVEEVLRFGRPYQFGLEAGSKPELLAVIALADNETPIICNGFKDAEFIEMVMLAQKIGRNIIPVVERFSELAQLLELCQKNWCSTEYRDADEIGDQREWSLACVGRVSK